MKISFGVNISDPRSAGAAAFVPTGLPTLELTLNALAFGTFSAGKSRYASTSGGVSLFYNFAFPRDFVSEVNSEDTISTDAGGTIPKDPFFGYRDDDGAINAALDVTIEIPSTMKIGGNSHGEFVTFDDISEAFENPVTGDKHAFFPDNSDINLTKFGGATPAANHIKGMVYNSYGNTKLTTTNSYAFYAMSDPSFMIDFNSNEVTSGTIEDTKLTINVNGGQVVGAGGFGGYGSITQDENSYTTDLSAGGGGGGQGLHPDLTSTGDSANNTWSLYYHDNASAILVGDPEDGRRDWVGFIDTNTSGGFRGRALGGQGGRSGSFVDQNFVPINAGNSPTAANGGFGTSSARGAGGAKGGSTTISVNFGGTAIDYGGQGGWGGSAFYFRSNTYTSTPITGTSIEIIATDDAVVAGGGGGGAGGHTNNDGSNGGLLGKAGSQSALSDGFPQGGQAGAALFWNTANVVCSNTFTLTSAGEGDEAKIIGRDITLEL